MRKIENTALDIEIFKDYYILRHKGVLFYIKNIHFLKLLRGFGKFLAKLDKRQFMYIADFALNTCGAIVKDITRVSDSISDFEELLTIHQPVQQIKVD